MILDAPSLAHAEAAPLARCCDGAYLVVRLGHTARRAVAEAAHALRAKAADCWAAWWSSRKQFTFRTAKHGGQARPLHGSKNTH